MPKDKGKSPLLPQKSRDHMYRPYSRYGNGSKDTLVTVESAVKHEWDDVTCPVCMEIPHNAVLLHCSSREKGCRPYMCDTSYRHSNCLDQYCKAHMASQKGFPDRIESIVGSSNIESSTPSQSTDNNDDAYMRNNLPRENYRKFTSLDGRDWVNLPCPLCRGQIQGWEIVKNAREHLNRKERVCSRESCSFTGSYEQLRAHARRDHPSARPTEIDPVLQNRWRRLERLQEFRDVLSVIESAVPQATLYDDRAVADNAGYVNAIGNHHANDEGHLFTVFLLFQVFGPVHSITESRPFIPFRRVSRRYHRSSGNSRQGLWGEILQHSRRNENVATDGHDHDGPVGMLPSWRQRRHRHRSPC